MEDGLHVAMPDGRHVLDGCSGRLRCPAGLHRPEIGQAVAAQLGALDRPPPAPFGNPLAQELERLVAGIAPEGFDRLLVTASGGQAIEIARLVARAATGREPLLVDPLAPPPAPDGRLVLLDERMTGFGRTGRPFAAQTLARAPDMLVLGEAMANGAVPIGGVLLPERLAQFAPQLPPAYPAALVAAKTTQLILRRENLFTRAERLAPHFAARIVPLGFRAVGLLGLLDLAPGSGADLAQRLLDAGLIVERIEDRLILAPALVAEAHHVDRMAGILAGVLASPPLRRNP
jgi:adenosylmethionine-8-amino-7-oxononanoate aminotransferase